MSDVPHSEADPALIDSTDLESAVGTRGDPRSVPTSAGTTALAGMIRFGRWLVRRRTPLVLIPTLAGIMIAASIGATMLLEEIPEPEAVLSPAVCWDKSEAPSAEDCALPTGKAGLRWVFPSFTPEESDCREVTGQGRGTPRPAEWECTLTVKNGVVVRITYIELADVQAGRIFYEQRYDGAERVSVQDRTGEVFRYQWRQRRADAFELATVYTDYPYAVTVVSENAAFRDKVFASRVKFRQPKGVAVRSDPAGAAAPDSTPPEEAEPTQESPASVARS